MLPPPVMPLAKQTISGWTSSCSQGNKEETSLPLYSKSISEIPYLSYFTQNS